MNNLLVEIEATTKKTYKIKDVGRVVTGKTPSKDNPLDWGQEVDFITPSDFSSDDKFLSDIKRKISTEGVNRYKNMILPPESVVVTCIGSDMGKVVVSQRVALTNQQINSIIVDRDVFDIDFIFYKLKSLYPELRSIAEEGGSTMPIITKTTFENIEFDAPELSIQKRIAEILGVYDEKIGNNNLIIKNLEATAQTLFDEWFVKFNFPGHEKVGLIESEIGEIPEGWEVGSVKDMIRVESGFPFSSSLFHPSGKYGLVTIRNVQDGSFVTNCESYLSILPEGIPKHCLLHTGDILLSLTGNVGRVCLVSGEDYVLNQRVAVLIPIVERNRAYTYFFFRRKDFQSLLISISKGTAQLNLSPVETKTLETFIPTEDVLEKYSEAVTPMYQKIVSINSENIRLKEARDHLLMQLI